MQSRPTLIQVLRRHIIVGQIFWIAVHALSIPFSSQVTGWLSDEGISWSPAEVPDQFHSQCSTFIELESSSILLHLIPTPTSPNETLPPLFNKRLTDLVAATGSKGRYSKVIHIFQDVWIAKNEIVKARLSVQSGEGQQRRIFARKTSVERINATFAMSFLEEHHLWGATRAKYYFGLFLERPKIVSNNNNRELVAVATFSARRRVKRDGWSFKSHELLRYCAQKNAFVVGGISKLCKAFISDVKPDDLVTVVDRDWGDGSGWHSIGFQTVATMDPLVMAVNPNEPGLRRHLVGAGIQVDDSTSLRANDNLRRLGLPQDLLKQVNATANVSEILMYFAEEKFFTVFDAGVERLFWVTNSSIPGSEQSLWKGSQPKYTSTYYSDNIGITSLLRDAGTESRPLDSPRSIMDSESWRATSGGARSARLIFSAPSSMDADAAVEVRERENGWRTVGIVGSKKNPSIYHSIYKVDEDGKVEPDVIVAEFIKTMAVLALAGTFHESDAKTTRFLHFGFGAGTLARYLANKVKSSQHVALELDRGVVDAANSLIPDSPNVSLLAQDALEFVEQAATQPVEPFDCICIDVFDETLKVPEEFYSRSFMAKLCDNLLAEDGILVQNFHSGGKRREVILRNAAIASSEVFENSFFVQSLDSKPNAGNCILFASRDPIQTQTGGDIFHTISHKALLVQDRLGLSFDAVARVMDAKSIS